MASVSPKKIYDEFLEDLSLVMSLASWIDKHIIYASDDCKAKFEKLKKLIDMFNKKYKAISLKLPLSVSERCIPAIFINDIDDLKSMFSEAALKIENLKSFGSSSFTDAEIKDSAKANSTIEKVKDKLYLMYQYEDNSVDMLLVQLKDNKAKLIISEEDRYSSRHPAFFIAAHYASLAEIDENINIHDEAKRLGSFDRRSYEEFKIQLYRWDPGFYQ